MKSLGFIFTIILVTFIGYVKAYATGPKMDANDSIVSFKSNIVIFKMIPSAVGINSTGANGSLKKAGKVARTSNSPHTTSIENILYKKKGI